MSSRHVLGVMIQWLSISTPTLRHMHCGRLRGCAVTVAEGPCASAVLSRMRTMHPTHATGGHGSPRGGRLPCPGHTVSSRPCTRTAVDVVYPVTVHAAAHVHDRIASGAPFQANSDFCCAPGDMPWTRRGRRARPGSRCTRSAGCWLCARHVRCARGPSLIPCTGSPAVHPLSGLSPEPFQRVRGTSSHAGASAGPVPPNEARPPMLETLLASDVAAPAGPGPRVVSGSATQLASAPPSGRPRDPRLARRQAKAQLHTATAGAAPQPGLPTAAAGLPHTQPQAARTAPAAPAAGPAPSRWDLVRPSHAQKGVPGGQDHPGHR